MKLRYQRDLYRVQLCCDTDQEESVFGYPLQMCLRNSIPGLLPCHGQTVDGKLSICWDITSRHDITQVTGEGNLPTALLRRILESLRKVMENMDRFLIPCEYLALEPSCIYLGTAYEDVSFLCDFSRKTSFHSTLPTLGEFVLEHMDHRDQEAIRLGYGLYRLAVEETFDREAFAGLLENTDAGQMRREPEQDADWQEAEANAGPRRAELDADRHEAKPNKAQRRLELSEVRRKSEQVAAGRRLEVKARPRKLEESAAWREARPNPIRQKTEEYSAEAARILSRENLRREYGAKENRIDSEDREEQRLRREALQSFFAEEDERKAGILPSKKTVLLCASAVILGVLAMEAVVYFRNGRHLSPGWLIVGAAVLLLSLAAFTAMEICCRWKAQAEDKLHQRKQKMVPDKEGKRNTPANKKNRDRFEKDDRPIASAVRYNACEAALSPSYAAYQRQHPVSQSLGSASGVMHPEMECAGESSDATMVLSTGQAYGGETGARLCCEDGTEFPLKGSHWLIGKRRSEVDICLEKPTVSRLHARIYRREETYFIEDLNSRNGTLLEGHMLECGQPEILMDGAEIRFADVCCVFSTGNS